MEKTVILVVDRDDDFGVKAGVATPAIGIDACAAAASALATADPEDSDSNALFAAINIYHQMEKSRPAGSFDIALICGDKSVGFKSDEELVKELNIVLEEVKPKGAVLVGDGAEDEYIYPVISSRVHIDSVRKVYVQQAPGVEGTLYIIGKYLHDPQKKKRFLSPIAFTLFAISLLYLIANALVYTNPKDFFLKSVSVLILMIISLVFLAYSYSLSDRIDARIERMKGGMKDGTTIVFFTLAVLLCLFGGIVGIYSLDSVYTYRFTQKILVFAINALWPVLFAIMMVYFGSFLSGYIANRAIRYSTIVGCLYILGAGLIATGFLDFMLQYTGVYASTTDYVYIEVIGGVIFFFLAIIVRAQLHRTAVAQQE